MKDIDFESFEKKIDTKFNDIALLKKAFTHRSYINENKGTKLEHNERLEFLGDAVLELSVTEYLFTKYPNKTEGELTSLRAALVNTQALSTVAESLGVNEYLLLSKGESKDTGRARSYILANTVESIIGAIYLDQGYKPADRFILKFIIPRIAEILETKSWIDAKSLFQEKAQETTNITPRYETIKETGPDHDKFFTVGVYIGDELVSNGDGNSKQEAEQEAARRALEEKGWA